MFGYTTSAVIAIAQMVLWFFILFVLVPRMLFSTRSPGSWARHLFDRVVQMSFVSILIVHLLVVLKIFDFFSLVAAYIIVYLAYQGWIRQVPLWSRGKAVWRRSTDSLFDLLDGRATWSSKLGPALSRTRQSFKEALPHGVNIWWAVLFGLVLVVSGYLRLYEAVRRPAPASADAYIHLLWFKGLGVERLYPDGLYPSGGYALLQLLHQFTVIDETLLLRLIPGLVGVLLVAAIYWTVTRLTGRRGPALIAAALYGIFAFARWLPLPLPPQGDVLTVELALVFLLPTFVFLAEALTGKKRKQADPAPANTTPASPDWLFFMGLACLFLIQPFAGLAALAGVLVALPVVGIFHWLPLRALRLAGLSLLATLVGSFPLLAGFGMGIPVHLGPLRWDVTFFGATLRAGRFFPPPPAAPEPLLLFYLGLAGAVLLLLLPGRWLGAGRTLSVAWHIFGLLLLGLAVLFRPAVLNLPELVLPHQVARLLTPVLCAVIGLSLHQILLIVGSFSRTSAQAETVSPGAGRLELSLTIAVLVALLLPFPSILIPTPTLAVSAAPKQEYDTLAEQIYRIKEELPTYRWTVVSYPETLSQILGHGFYIENEDFLENYRPETWRFDPRRPELAVSTPHVFIFTEKHPFVVPGDTTQEAIQRDVTQQRLREWVRRYQELHTDMDLFYEDGRIAVYHIYRTPEEEKRILAAIEAGLMPTHIPPPAPTPAPAEGTPAPGATPGVPAAPATYQVQRGQIVSQVAFDGQIAPARQQELAFSTGGRVAKVYVAPGDSVAVGDLLAELDTTQLEQNLALAQMDLEIIKTSRQAAEERLEAEIEAAQLALTVSQLELQAARLQGARPPQAETAAELERAFKALQSVEAEFEQVQQALFSPEDQNEDVKRVWGTDWMWLVMRNAENLEMATSSYFSETLYYEQAQQDKLLYNNYTVPISERYVELAQLRLDTLKESFDPAYQKAVERAKLNVKRLEEALADARQRLADETLPPDQQVARQALITELEQELESAQAELEQAQKELAAVERELANDIEQAELDLQTAQRNLESVKDQAPALQFSELEVETNLEKTKAWLEQAQAEYNQVIELGTPPELFSRLHQARMDHIEARAAYEAATRGTLYDAAVLEQEISRAEQNLAELEARQGSSLVREEEQARLAVKRLEEELAGAQLVAPLTGQVMALNLTAGVEVEANRPVAVVANTGELEVAAALEPAQIQRLEEGLAVTIAPLAAGASSQTLEGYIRYLPAPAEADGRPAPEFGAEELGGPDRLARIALTTSATEAGYQTGDRVRGTAWLGREDDALWLPPRAIRTGPDGQKFVSVQDDDGKRQVNIETGLESAERVEITSGLSEGQTVIVP